MDRKFSNLSAQEFEKLALDLVGRELGLRFEAFGVGADGGIDARYSAPGVMMILQVKHYEGTGFNGLKSTMKKERGKLAMLNPTRYLLATSVPLSPANKDTIVGLIAPWPLSTGDIFGHDDLNQLLARHPEVQQEYEGLWQESAAVLHSLVGKAVKDAIDAPDRDVPRYAPALAKMDIAGSVNIPVSHLDNGTFPLDLIRSFLSGGSVVPKEQIDRILTGSHTATAKGERDAILGRRADELQALSRLRSAASSESSRLSSDLRTIEALQKPREPFASGFSGLTPEQYNQRQDQLDRDRRDYREQLAKYEREQQRLPELRDSKRRADEQVGRYDADIARQQAETSYDEIRLRKGVDAARDRDFAHDIERVVSQARQDFDDSMNVAGFLTLLGCAALYEMFKPHFHTPDTARAVAERIRTFGEVPRRVEKDFLPPIAHICLAGPLKLADNLKSNRTAAAALLDRLNHLPLVEMGLDIERLKAVTTLKPPQIPSVDKLERMSEIARMTEQLDEARAAAEMQIAAIQSEIDAEIAERRETIRAANVDVSRVVAQISIAARSDDSLKSRTTLIWQLIERASKDQILPASWRELCVDLKTEVSRRLGEPVMNFLSLADLSDLGLVDLRSSVSDHVVTQYNDARETLGTEIAAWIAHKDGIAKALATVRAQPERVSEKYRGRLQAATYLSLIPVVSFVCALWSWKITSAVTELIIDGGSSYRALAVYARKLLSIALFIHVIIASTATAATWFCIGDARFDQSITTWVISAAAFCGLGLIVALRNLIVLRSGIGSSPPLDHLAIQ